MLHGGKHQNGYHNMMISLCFQASSWSVDMIIYFLEMFIVGAVVLF